MLLKLNSTLQKRRDYAIQIQQLLMNDGAALFLGYPKTNIVTGSYLKGAVMYPSDYYWITNKILNNKEL